MKTGRWVSESVNGGFNKTRNDKGRIVFNFLAS